MFDFLGADPATAIYPQYLHHVLWHYSVYMHDISKVIPYMELLFLLSPHDLNKSLPFWIPWFVLTGARGKPLGKPRAKPWVDIAKSHGLGGGDGHGGKSCLGICKSMWIGYFYHWWFMVMYMVIYGDVWWCVVIYGDLWWFMVMYGDVWWFKVNYGDLYVI